MVALAVHALAIVALIQLLPERTAHPVATVARAGSSSADADRPIEIETLVDELERPSLAAEAEKRDEEKRQLEEEKAEGQVVDIARPPIEERPDDAARFLAEYNSRVRHETRGKWGRDRGGAPIERAPSSEPPVPKAPAKRGEPIPRPGRPGAPGLPPRPARPGLGQGGAAEELDSDGTSLRAGAPGEGRATRPAPGTGGLPGMPGEPRPNLVPTEDVLARAIGKGPGSPDYLRDIDDGEATALNAKKFKYASFFNRVKRAVAEEWHPDLVYLRHDPNGQVYGVKDRVTVLRVHLSPDGRLHGVTIRQASGIDFLDDEAIDSFRRAQPFPNPPSQLVDADGLIHFNFGFIFELSGNTSFKVFKYR